MFGYPLHDAGTINACLYPYHSSLTPEEPSPVCKAPYNPLMLLIPSIYSSTNKTARPWSSRPSLPLSESPQYFSSSLLPLRVWPLKTAILPRCVHKNTSFLTHSLTHSPSLSSLGHSISYCKQKKKKAHEESNGDYNKEKHSHRGMTGQYSLIRGVSRTGNKQDERYMPAGAFCSALLLRHAFEVWSLTLF